MISKAQLRTILYLDILERVKQGYEAEAYLKELEGLPDSYDALMDMAQRLRNAPKRADWRYEEPDVQEEIMAACHAGRETGRIAAITEEEATKRAEAAFMASVCACILGKPLEEAPIGTLWDIREAAQKAGEWPVKEYFSEKMLEYWGRRNQSWVETTRGRVRHVAPDDDITYSICGMLLLEAKGVNFTHDDMRQLWIENLPIYTCWGPERNILIKAGIASIIPGSSDEMAAWPDIFNPGQEYCGALIRADAYGYACPGYPELAAKLALKDASFTHRKSGVYSTMFIAAAIAAAFVAKEPLQIFDIALQYVPQNSRFHELASEALEIVRTAADFDQGYERIHNRFSEYGACRIIQEVGTLFNTLKFAKNVEEGITLQVAQGNDTDSFGCTCGSILGAYYGEQLPDRWTAPFNDCLHTTMGGFHEYRLSAVTERMGRLHYITKNL